MSRVVLDTSAILALCFSEKGAKLTAAKGKDGVVSAVNYSEAIAKSSDRGIPVDTVNDALASLQLTVVPFDHTHAVAAASFRPATRHKDISFADRACFCTAALARLPIMTAVKNWKKLRLGLDIVLIR